MAERPMDEPSPLERAEGKFSGLGFAVPTVALICLLGWSAASFWHAQMQAAEARGRAQAMAYRAPEPVVVPQVVCPEPVRPAAAKRQPAARPAVPALDAAQVVPAPRPQTDLDRRLAEFQAEIDATPNPMKELSR